MKAAPVILAALLALLAGCDFVSAKFELVNVSGNAYIVNKQTGELRLVDGTSLVPVKNVDSGSGLGKSMLKNWPAVKIPVQGELSVAARTSYRDGKLLYTVTAAPYEGALEKQLSRAYSTPTFLVEFYDQDQFLIHTLRLPLRGESTRIVDEKGQAQQLQWQGAVAMSKETYEALAGSNVKWSGFGD